MKRTIFCLIFIGVAVIFYHSPGMAAETNDLGAKVKQLEKRMGAVELQGKEGKGQVDAFLAEHISLGGFFEHAVTGNFSTVHSYQISADSNILGINLGAKLNERFSLVTQELVVLAFPLLNPHDATKRTFSGSPPTIAALVAHAYGEYLVNEKFRIQTGLGWVPFGIAPQEREFPLLMRKGGPQIASGGLGMPFALWEGLQVLGNFSTDSGTYGYNLYTLTPTSNVNRLGTGSRLHWSSPREAVKIGASSQVLKGGTDTIFNLGGDLELKVKLFGLKTEYARSITDGEDVWTAYGEPYVEFPGGKWLVHGDLDYAKRPLQGFDPATFTPFERLQMGGGVNFLPWPFLRTRLLVLYNKYLGASATSGGLTNDFYTVEYSAGIEF